VKLILQDIPCTLVGQADTTELPFKKVSFFVGPSFGHMSREDKNNAIARQYINALQSIDAFPHLVLEDDVALTKNFKKEIEIPDKYGVIYFGASSIGLQEINGSFVISDSKFIATSNPDYHLIYNMLTCHAVFLKNKETRDELVDILEKNPQEGHPYDFYLIENQKKAKWAVATKPLFCQTDGNRVCTDITL